MPQFRIFMRRLRKKKPGFATDTVTPYREVIRLVKDCFNVGPGDGPEGAKFAWPWITER